MTTMKNFLFEAYHYARNTFSIVYAKGANYVLMRAWGEKDPLWRYMELARKWYGVTITCIELSSGTVYRAEGDSWVVVFNFPRVK